jgi:DNA-directed RNA polymerase subunit beta'
MNKALKKKEISKLINASFRKCGLKATVVFADKLMQNGFRLSTRAGISIAIDDMLVPPQKADILAAPSRSEGDRAAVRLGSGDLRRALQQGGGHLGQGRRRSVQGDDGPAQGQKTTDRHGNEVDQNRSTRST